MKVTFYLTTKDGSEEIGTITYVGGRVTTTGDEFLVGLLFGDEDPKNLSKDGIEKVMQDSPVRFDGAYLRAAFEG